MKSETASTMTNYHEPLFSNTDNRIDKLSNCQKIICDEHFVHLLLPYNWHDLTIEYKSGYATALLDIGQSNDSSLALALAATTSMTTPKKRHKKWQVGHDTAWDKELAMVLVQVERDKTDADAFEEWKLKVQNSWCQKRWLWDGQMRCNCTAPGQTDAMQLHSTMWLCHIDNNWHDNLNKSGSCALCDVKHPP